MIPILYDTTEQNFTSQGLGSLADAVSCKIKTVLNGQFELELKYPVSGRRYKDIKIPRIIKAVAEKGGTPQLFDIYRITKPIKGIISVYASHVSNRKQYIPVMPCEASNIQDAFTEIASHTVETNPFTLWTDKTTRANFRLKSPASLGNVLGGMEGSVLDTFRGEYEFDNFTIKFTDRRGADNGVTLRYGKNITSIEQDESIANTITGICPFWADLDGNTVTLPENTVDSANAENFPFKRTVPMDFSLLFEEKPTEVQLRMAANNYIENNGIGVPDVGLTISFEHLSDYEEYKDMGAIDEVHLGDTVHVFFEPLEITAIARVIQTEYDCLLEKYDRIRIGSAKATLTSTMEAIATGKTSKYINGVEALKNAMANIEGDMDSVPGQIEQAILDALGEDGAIWSEINEATEGLISASDVEQRFNEILETYVTSETIQQWISDAIGTYRNELNQFLTWSDEDGLSIKAKNDAGLQSQTYLNLMNDRLAFVYGLTIPAWMTANAFNINNLIVNETASLMGLIMQKVTVNNVDYLRIS